MYEDVLALYENGKTTQEYPMRIRFQDEQAVDLGGVFRDMLAGFWEVAYQRLFDGSTLLTPAMHAGVDFLIFPLLGRVMSHGYLAGGYLPVQIAFPCLCTMLLENTEGISDSMLLDAFASAISPVEASFLKGCFSVISSVFSSGVQEKLVALLCRFGCRELPTPNKLRQQVIRVSRFEFVVKPMAAVAKIKEGIPPSHCPFWRSLSIDNFHSIYKALAASPAKVLSMLEEPAVGMNQAQDRVYSYLVEYVGQMKCDEVRRFLRFITGSTVCVSTSIKVNFNTLTGLARRPISHTCTCTLDLSTEYQSYYDFSSEFDCILSDNQYTWLMDAM